MKNLNDELRSGAATIVDVRTREEFEAGHAPGSINIPLPEISGRIDELKACNNIVLCCASGGRSGLAEIYLKQAGVNCRNAGSWIHVANSLTS